MEDRKNSIWPIVLMIFGGLLMALSGGCTVLFVGLAGWAALMIGAVPFLIGLILFVLGRRWRQR